MSHPPVVLVHGFLATPTLMSPMRWRLERGGRRVVTPELSPLCIQDVRKLARQLDATVEKARRELGQDRVDVVGVSQGGILSLWWAHHVGGWSKVRRLVLVGSPVQGTWAAAAGLPLLGAVSRGIWQMLPSSPFLPELDVPLPEGADLTTLSIRGDPVCPAERCAVRGAENLVFEGPPGPLKHQYLIFSRPVYRHLEEVLDRT